MGYAEIYCQICGVSFNIGRLRRPDEPRSAAWLQYGEDFPKADPDSFVRCGREAGCLMVDRGEESDMFKDPWTREQVVDVEEYWRTIIEAKHASEGARAAESNQHSSDEVIDEDEPERKQYFSEDEVEAEDMGEAYEDAADDEPPDMEGLDEENLEHIAGPGCRSCDGYVGQRLSLEEMEFCRIWQSLVLKDDSDEGAAFEPEQDDEPFERDAKVFLSGVADDMPEIETSGEAETFPVRHGIEPIPNNHPLPNNHPEDYEEAPSLPFHPWCLEIFKRASIAKSGEIDMDGLWGWYTHENSYEQFAAFPRSGPTRVLQQQWWPHTKRSEWLVCNPLWMPSLHAALQITVPTNPSFDIDQGAFTIEEHQLNKGPNECDTFASLPIELRLMILRDLPSMDIASLRLSSRAFRQLPISLWRDLVQRDFPWFWEILPSSSTTYSFWTTTSAAELRKAPIPAEERKHVPVPDLGLDTTKTNWYELYLLLSKRRDDVGHRALRGLRNRERIWKDCEVILRRIEKHQAEWDAEAEGAS